VIVVKEHIVNHLTMAERRISKGVKMPCLPWPRDELVIKGSVQVQARIFVRIQTGCNLGIPRLPLLAIVVEGVICGEASLSIALLE